MRRIVRLFLPWFVVAVFAVLYSRFVWPALVGGHPLGVTIGAFVSLVFVSLALAALTMSWDVLRGR